MSHLIHRNPDGARKRTADKAAPKPPPEQQPTQTTEPAQQQSMMPRKSAATGPPASTYSYQYQVMPISDAGSFAPQVKLDAKGNIVVDNDSLVMEARGDEVDTTYGTGMQRCGLFILIRL